jgi:hypothetical protein
MTEQGDSAGALEKTQNALHDVELRINSVPKHAFLVSLHKKCKAHHRQDKTEADKVA